MAPPVIVINGPNLNLLGAREPAIYGTTTLLELERACVAYGRDLGLDVTCRQSNHEGAIVDWIQEARTASGGLVINAGAYSHTSIAIRDALAVYEAPVIEVHLSNIYRRERFRHRSHISPVATGVICGLGVESYNLALRALARLLDPSPAKQH